MKRVNVSLEDLRAAAVRGIVPADAPESLWAFLVERAAETPAPLPAPGNTQPAPRGGLFDLAHVAWFTGAAIVMLAMSWFTFEMWEKLGGAGVTVLSLLYIAAFAFVGKRLWNNAETRVPGGLLFTIAVSIVPLTVLGVSTMLDLTRASQETTVFLLMSAATIAAGLFTARRYPFAFIGAPVAVAIWGFGASLSELLFPNLQWTAMMQLMLGYAVAVIAGSIYIDKRTQQDFAFWGYFTGAIGFWAALGSLLVWNWNGNTELGYFAFAVINAAMMLVSPIFGRRIFLVLGSIGVLQYIGHLGWDLFANSALFPAFLAAAGIAVIWAGIMYHRNRQRIDQAVLNVVPDSVRNWLPRR